jgi:hypothetical protein
MLKTVSAVIGAMALTTLLIGRDSATSRAGSDGSAANAAQQQPVLTYLTPSAQATLHDAPQGKELGRVSPGASLTTLARERGWVRVRFEAWVNESSLVPLDSALRMSPSAADVRADPAGMKGRLVRWDLEFISWQRADPLRRDMRPDEWYILARGPGSENSISYLVVPESLRSTAESITPLSRIVVTARVRVGRSSPVGVPILDVESLSRR